MSKTGCNKEKNWTHFFQTVRGRHLFAKRVGIPGTATSRADNSLQLDRRIIRKNREKRARMLRGQSIKTPEGHLRRASPSLFPDSDKASESPPH
jgi:hypothetical protein